MGEANLKGQEYDLLVSPVYSALRWHGTGLGR